jgi:hypothetical protein
VEAVIGGNHSLGTITGVSRIDRAPLGELVHLGSQWAILNRAVFLTPYEKALQSIFDRLSM